MTSTRRFLWVIFLFLAAVLRPVAVLAQGLPGQVITSPMAATPVGAYVLGDSIANGLQIAGLEAQLQGQLGRPARINFDGGRSITTPGSQIKKSALDSVEASPVVPHGTKADEPLSICQSMRRRNAFSSNAPSRKGVTRAGMEPENMDNIPQFAA